MAHTYTTPTMLNCWSRQSQIDRWSTLESALLRELVPGVNLRTPRVDAGEVDTLEDQTGHEIGAFLELFEAQLEHPEHKRWLHYGLTSSDLVDSGRQMALHSTTNQLHSAAIRLLQVVSQMPAVPVVGRTHGQPASPTSYRHRWVVAMDNAFELLAWECETRPQLMFSGAVGRYRVLSLEVAQRVARSLGAGLILKSTQVAPARYTVGYLNLWQGLVLAMEQIATDIRLGAMLNEVRQPALRVGSTAMPGKVNPVKAEQICGLAKLWHAEYQVVVASRVQWLDRDLVNSSIDREVFGRLAGLAHYMAETLLGLLPVLGLRRTFKNTTVAPPGPNADVLLSLATWAYDAPRSVVYGRVSAAVRACDTTQGVLAAMHRWALDKDGPLPRSLQWDGTLGALTRRYGVC